MTNAEKALKNRGDIAAGRKGTCKECGKVVRVRIPDQGDGTVRLCSRHGDCPGGNRPAKEWDFPR